MAEFGVRSNLTKLPHLMVPLELETLPIAQLPIADLLLREHANPKVIHAA